MRERRNHLRTQRSGNSLLQNKNRKDESLEPASNLRRAKGNIGEERKITDRRDEEDRLLTWRKTDEDNREKR